MLKIMSELLIAISATDAASQLILIFVEIIYYSCFIEATLRWRKE